MSRSVLILGGAGNFGKRIATALAHKNVPVIVAGRNLARAKELVQTLPQAQAVQLDLTKDWNADLVRLRPAVVVNTCGPFQGSDYRVAQTCIAQGVHYVDLADGRAFVTGITALDALARAADVAVISGASTVPGLSSAVVEALHSGFAVIERMRYSISPGQQAERGLATTQGILSYVGKPLAPWPGQTRPVFGWQDIYRQDYPELGKRWLANCDIPDLDLLPARYGIKHIQFSAGLELGPLHLGLWGLSWLVRLGLPLNLPRYAAPLLAISNWFDRFGSADGGMHVLLQGKGHDGQPLQRRWCIIARQGHGPHIPTIPAIILAERLARGTLQRAGAMPCCGLVSLEDYLAELKGYDVQVY
jgi:hypothetical protein